LLGSVALIHEQPVVLNPSTQQSEILNMQLNVSGNGEDGRRYGAKEKQNFGKKHGNMNKTKRKLNYNMSGRKGKRRKIRGKKNSRNIKREEVRLGQEK
jgi:hypothetical protein